jgi:hypothetical protein
MHEKRQILRECKCFKLNIRNSYKNGMYSEEQNVESHERDILQSLKQDEEII